MIIITHLLKLWIFLLLFVSIFINLMGRVVHILLYIVVSIRTTILILWLVELNLCFFLLQFLRQSLLFFR